MLRRALQGTGEPQKGRKRIFRDPIARGLRRGEELVRDEIGRGRPLGRRILKG
jgi:hypothetical protein